MELTNLKDILKQSGVVGAGGAGFPSYAKLDSKAETILLNCAECEPLLKLHRQVLEKFSYEIMTALDIVSKAVGAKEVKICIKGSYKGAIEAVNSYIDAFENFDVCFLPEIYPAGDEVVLIYEATGKRVPPGGIPINIGCIVYNVETMLNIYYATTQNKSVTHKYVTVAGEVKNPKTLLAPVGITYGELISACGGATVKDVELLAGGPMTGKLAKLTDVVTKTSNAVLVLPKGHCIISNRQLKASIGMKRAMSSCCQCRMCTDLCPRNALGYPIDPSEFMKSASSGTVSRVAPMLDTFFCSQCGICELFACNQGLSPKTLIDVYRTELRKNGVKPPVREIGEIKKDFKHRRVSMMRLISRLNLSKYNVPAPISEEVVKAKRVKIMLAQHIGAPSVPKVKKGDVVCLGDVLANVPGNALGADIHSSVDGKVLEVNEKFILIDA